MLSAELFAGCGGLAMGMSRAGFKHSYMAEFDRDAVATVLHNKALGIEHVRDWPMGLQDVRDVDWTAIKKLELLSGGPPCQPFGIGGKKAGLTDDRDMWPEAIRAVREAQPRLFLFENVRNIAGPKFRSYLEWIVAHLERPSMVRNPEEPHLSHALRMAKARRTPEYRVTWQVVNAADYGAAQIRHRVLIFGLRYDVDVAPFAMSPTHFATGCSGISTSPENTGIGTA